MSVVSLSAKTQRFVVANDDIRIVFWHWRRVNLPKRFGYIDPHLPPEVPPFSVEIKKTPTSRQSVLGLMTM